jgi:hypothetical protein
MAIVLPTLLGPAGEATGLDRTLRTSTVATRTLSLLNHGILLTGASPGGPCSSARGTPGPGGP